MKIELPQKLPNYLLCVSSLIGSKESPIQYTKEATAKKAYNRNLAKYAHKIKYLNFFNCLGFVVNLILCYHFTISVFFKLI